MGCSTKAATLFSVALAAALIAQACSKVNFQGTGGTVLTTGMNTAAGVSPTPGTDTNPTPTPTPPTDTSPTPTPPTNNPTIALCYLSAGPGESQRIGSNSTVQALDVATAIPHDACMSTYACLDLINTYLNHTAGQLDGHYGPLQANPSQYTAVKINGVCAHNPNVQHLTDAQISAALANMQTLHQ